MLQDLLKAVSLARLRCDLFHLAGSPLPFRKVNYTRPGQSLASLDEADAYLQAQLQGAGWEVRRTPYRVQPFRCDCTKPLHHWYSAPAPEDPWYEACNLEAEKPGSASPDEIIQLIAHKDSMSWIDSPGAHDNGVGTVANLELARILAACPTQRTIRILLCNEEHTPWTSRFAAEAAAARGDRIIAVLNLDSLDGKSDADMAAGRLTHVVGYSTDEGRPLAQLVERCNRSHGIGLEVSVAYKQHINDDDGMFINAGFRTTVMNLGSWPYADAEYHLPGDRPERVNLENLKRSTQLILAAVLELDAQGCGALTA
jgi:hypothetical protein